MKKNIHVLLVVAFMAVSSFSAIAGGNVCKYAIDKPVVVTTNHTLNGAAILSPGTILGDKLSIEGRKMGDFVNPAGTPDLPSGFVLVESLELPRGSIIPKGTTVESGSSFQYSDELPVSGFNIAGLPVSAFDVVSPHHLTRFVRQEKKRNGKVSNDIRDLYQKISAASHDRTQISNRIARLESRVSENERQISRIFNHLPIPEHPSSQ